MAKLQQEENTVFHAGFFQPEAFKQKAVQIKVLETAKQHWTTVTVCL